MDFLGEITQRYPVTGVSVTKVGWETSWSGTEMLAAFRVTSSIHLRALWILVQLTISALKNFNSAVGKQPMIVLDLLSNLNSRTNEIHSHIVASSVVLVRKVPDSNLGHKLQYSDGFVVFPSSFLWSGWYYFVYHDGMLMYYSRLNFHNSSFKFHSTLYNIRSGDSVMK
jgi:hypothetical protein